MTGLSGQTQRSEVFVSPHFDDAVFSLGGALSRSTARTRIVTVCGGAPAARAPLSSWDTRCGFATPDHATAGRLEEDRIACSRIGSEFIHLPFADYPYTGRKEPRAIADMLAPLLSSAHTIWAPLGIGLHPDHLATRDAVILLAAEICAEILFYADSPYAGAHGWLTDDAKRDERFRWKPALDSAREKGASLGMPQLEPLSHPVLREKLSLASSYASQLPGLQLHYPRLMDVDGPLAHECTWVCKVQGSETSLVAS